jgi:His-Xaa-Ser system radical SAM maturase HxsC
MAEPVRIDKFEVISTYPPGYYQLWKDKSGGSKFLPELIILSEDDTGIEDLAYLVHPELYQLISDADIASVSTNGKLRVILSRNANHNTVLVTERCNNLCSFCSQPPKPGNDDWLLGQAMSALADFNFEGVVGVSGGEPLLYGQRFIDFLDFVKEFSPKTDLHILTNGRAFSNLEFTKEIANRQSDLHFSFGVPLYSTNADVHDELVGAKGAFSETVKGIINAGNLGLNIELRYIPTKNNSNDLPNVIEYANRVFSNIAQISMMNLEPMGWARKNWESLYISPLDYSSTILRSIRASNFGVIPLVLFNYPLCHLDQIAWSYAVKSISDWKNHYPAGCEGCRMIDSCGGYFASAEGKYLDEPRKIQ